MGKLTIEKLQEMAAAKGGECLTLSYNGLRSPYEWKCAKGHTWTAWGSSVRDGHWCMLCRVKPPSLSIDDLHKTATDRGGKCLSTVYTNVDAKYLWECSLGHRWEAQAYNVRGGGWCPKCKKGREPRPLDVARDIAVSKGGALLTAVAGTTSRNQWKCARGHVWETKALNIERGQWCPDCSGTKKLSIEILQQDALAFGGKCLSNRYINNRKHCRWECAKGHKWLATPDSVRAGHWCPSCVGIVSVGESEVFDFVKSMVADAIQSDRITLAPKELDIWIPSLKLGIEYCGLYWHGEIVSGEEAKIRHIDKLRAAEMLGIRLVTIFEDEWMFRRPQVEGYLRAILGAQMQRIGARECEVEETASTQISQFMEDNHLQGAGYGPSYCLKHSGEIVAAASFNKSKDGWVLNRFCIKIGLAIPGGLLRLLGAFIADYSPKRIVSFSDRRWSIGKMYASAGFVVDKVTSPNYWYVQGKRRIHKFNFRRKKLISMGADPRSTEWPMAQSVGLDRIWDCGLIKWAKEFA